MSIVSVLILVVVAISIVWAFKTGYVKALSEGYVFSFTTGTTEDGSSVPVLRLERGWRARKSVAASPVNENIRNKYRVSEKQISHFLNNNQEGYGQRLIPLMKVEQQREQNLTDPSLLYNAKAMQKAQDAYRQAAEQVQEELEKVYRRVDFLSSGAVEGAGGVFALRDVRENRAEFDNPLTLSSARWLGMAAQGLGLLSRSAYENFLDSCEGMDKEDIVLMDEDVRQEIMRYVDDPKQERKLRRRQKWSSFWEYPLDSQWSWGKSLNLKGQERKP
jgi:hypothetical protein